MQTPHRSRAASTRSQPAAASAAACRVVVEVGCEHVAGLAMTLEEHDRTGVDHLDGATRAPGSAARGARARAPPCSSRSEDRVPADDARAAPPQAAGSTARSRAKSVRTSVTRAATEGRRPGVPRVAVGAGPVRELQLHTAAAGCGSPGCAGRPPASTGGSPAGRRPPASRRRRPGVGPRGRAARSRRPTTDEDRVGLLGPEVAVHRDHDVDVVEERGEPRRLARVDVVRGDVPAEGPRLGHDVGRGAGGTEPRPRRCPRSRARCRRGARGSPAGSRARRAPRRRSTAAAGRTPRRRYRAAGGPSDTLTPMTDVDASQGVPSAPSTPCSSAVAVRSGWRRSPGWRR